MSIHEEGEMLCFSFVVLYQCLIKYEYATIFGRISPHYVFLKWFTTNAQINMNKLRESWVYDSCSFSKRWNLIVAWLVAFINRMAFCYCIGARKQRPCWMGCFLISNLDQLTGTSAIFSFWCDSWLEKAFLI